MYVFEFWAPHNALLTVPVPRTVPPAAAAQVSQVVPSAVGLASIKAEWAAQIASLNQGDQDPKESQCPELRFAVVSALSPETIPFIPPTAQRSPPSALTMLKNCVEAKTIQKSLRIPKTTFFDWLNKAREAGTMTAAGDRQTSSRPLQLNAQACRGSFGFTGRANQVLRDDNKTNKTIDPFQGQWLKILCLVYLRKYLMRELVKRTF